MKWDELSDNARAEMEWLGRFGPTNSKLLLKGYRLDEDGDEGKAYLNASELRRIAAACLEVAAWMEQPEIIVDGKII